MELSSNPALPTASEPPLSKPRKPQLLTLPWEIRRAIHTFACSGATAKILFRIELNHDGSPLYWTHVLSYENPMYSILLVCKQIFDEVRHILAKELILAIGVSSLTAYGGALDDAMDKYLLPSSAGTGFLKYACHSLERMTLSLMNLKWFDSRPLSPWHLVSALPALKSVHLCQDIGLNAYNIEPLNTDYVKKVRCVSKERGIADCWAGHLALGCAFQYWCMTECILQYQYRQYGVTFEIEACLVDGTEKGTRIV